MNIHKTSFILGFAIVACLSGGGCANTGRKQAAVIQYETLQRCVAIASEMAANDHPIFAVEKQGTVLMEFENSRPFVLTVYIPFNGPGQMLRFMYYEFVSFKHGAGNGDDLKTAMKRSDSFFLKSRGIIADDGIKIPLAVNRGDPETLDKGK